MGRRNAYFPGVISRYIPTSEAEDANANAIFEITYDDGDVEKLKNFQSEKVIWFSNEYVPKKRLTAEEAYIESEKNLGRFKVCFESVAVAALTVLKARGSRSLEDAKKEQIASRQQVGFVQDYVHRADVRERGSERASMRTDSWSRVFELLLRRCRGGWRSNHRCRPMR